MNNPEPGHKKTEGMPVKRTSREETPSEIFAGCAKTARDRSPAPSDGLPDERKALQRKHCLEARAGLSRREREERSQRISENLLKSLRSLPCVTPGATILAYAAFGDEADPGLCLRELRSMDVRVAFPAIMPGRQMLAAAPFDEAGMLPDRFGIPTPDLRRSETVLPEELSAVLVPCVGFDRRGQRLGHGWGYYDRFLVRCPKASRLLVAFAVQELPEIAVGPYDLPMDTIITEEGILSFKREEG